MDELVKRRAPLRYGLVATVLVDGISLASLLRFMSAFKNANTGIVWSAGDASRT